MLSLFSPVALSLLSGCSLECCEPIRHPATNNPGCTQAVIRSDVGSELATINDGVFSPLGIPTAALEPGCFVTGMRACGTLTGVQLRDVSETQYYGDLVLPCCGDGSPHPVWQSGRRAIGCMAFCMHRVQLGEIVLPKARSKAYVPMSGFRALGNVFIHTRPGCTHALSRSRLAAGVGITVYGRASVISYRFQSLENTPLAGTAYQVLARRYQPGMRVPAGMRQAIRVVDGLASSQGGHECSGDSEQSVIQSVVSEQDVVAGWTDDHVIVCGKETGAADLTVMLADGKTIQVKVYFV